MVCDRFVDSSLAYQGGAGGLGFDAVRALHEIGSHGFLPDRTLLLRPAGAAMRTARAERPRRRHGADRIGGRDARLSSTASPRLRDARRGGAGRAIRVVDAAGTPEEVTARLLAALEDLL